MTLFDGGSVTALGISAKYHTYVSTGMHNLLKVQLKVQWCHAALYVQQQHIGLLHTSAS